MFEQIDPRFLECRLWKLAFIHEEISYFNKLKNLTFRVSTYTTYILSLIHI